MQSITIDKLIQYTTRDPYEIAVFGALQAFKNGTVTLDEALAEFKEAAMDAAYPNNEE